MTLSSIFQENPNIIINTDIDGFLCGWLLCKYYNTKIVGFSNSKDMIWLDKSVEDNIFKPVYIDLYVNNPDTISIDQHMIAVDEKHKKTLSPNKINPNLMRPYHNFYDNYYHKYPFGTFHFLAAMAEKEGVKIELPNLRLEYSFNEELKATLGEIIMRADDALYTTFKYKENADDWWRWLYEYSNESNTIRQMAEFVYGSNKEKIDEQKQRTGRFFQEGYQCDGADGAFTYIADFTGKIISKVESFFHSICHIMSNDHFYLPSEFNIHRGVWKKEKYRFTSNLVLYDVCNDKSLFSYAFIYGATSKYPNFSATYDMK